MKKKIVNQKGKYNPHPMCIFFFFTHEKSIFLLTDNNLKLKILHNI